MFEVCQLQAAATSPLIKDRMLTLLSYDTCGKHGILLKLFKQSLCIVSKEKNKSGKQCMLIDCNGEHMTEREMPWKLQKQALVAKLLFIIDITSNNLKWLNKFYLYKLVIIFDLSLLGC